MEKINEHLYVIQTGDDITFIREHGGFLTVVVEDECEPAPLISEGGIDKVIMNTVVYLNIRCSVTLTGK